MKELGDRMKERYENRFRYYLPRRTYTIIRVDGKAFHGLDLDSPFDDEFGESMRNTALHMAESIQGAQLAYQQSDEISLLLTDFDKDNTEAWFSNNLQKLVSISASMATAKFNDDFGGTNHFDSRAFTIADPVEVENYFIWRQLDAIRNSIQMVARANFSHRECDNKSCRELREMLEQKGVVWADDFDSYYKYGCLVHEHLVMKDTPNGRIQATQFRKTRTGKFTENRLDILIEDARKKNDERNCS